MGNNYDDVIKTLTDILYDSNGVFNTRVRIAVTPDEFQHIREYCLDRYGMFFARLRNVVLIVENDPTKPQVFVEYAQHEAQAM